MRAAVAEAFGAGVLAADGGRSIGDLGRSSSAIRRHCGRLEGILHPAVRRTIRAAAGERYRTDAVAVVDAVKLLEGELGTLAHSVWWVTATPEQQLAAAAGSRLWARREAQARLAAQPSLAEWRPRVNVVIDNSGSLTDTRRQVLTALQNVLAAPPSRWRGPVEGKKKHGNE